ncbi:unnamed protein product [Gongylonema pulchrum]|uniref:Transposase n=1 Tax=Gongylonema pulchrum TaxID=637853 RepID=A0A183EHK4_9BILA|nr:unnamed protein product [Gongylonema pulchrum]
MWVDGLCPEHGRDALVPRWHSAGNGYEEWWSTCGSAAQVQLLQTENVSPGCRAFLSGNIRPTKKARLDVLPGSGIAGGQCGLSKVLPCDINGTSRRMHRLRTKGELVRNAGLLPYIHFGRLIADHERIRRWQLRTHITEN